MVQRTPVLLSPLRHFTNCRAWNMSKPVVISSQRRKVGSDSNSVATDTLLLSPPVNFQCLFSMFIFNVYFQCSSCDQLFMHGQFKFCFVKMLINPLDY